MRLSLKVLYLLCYGIGALGLLTGNWIETQYLRIGRS